MRILIVNGLPWLGGAERWAVSLARELVARGHGVGVAHDARSPLGPMAAACGATPIPLPDARRGSLLPLAVWLARRIRRDGWDVVVATVRREVKPVGIAARLAGQPGAVARLRSGWDPSRPRDVWREQRHRWYHRWFIQLAATNSRAGRDDLIARGYLPAARIVAIHNGVDLERFDPDAVPPGRFRAALGIPAGEPLVVSLSRFVPRKGQAHELEAMGRLVAERPDLHVVFVGPCAEEEKPYLGRLRARAGSFSGHDRIRFLGPRDDVPAVLADADVLIRGAVEEGLPNVVLEAMAMRVPVVATAICGTPEAVVDGETGRLVPPGDPAALAAAVAELLDVPAWQRAAIGVKGRNRVQRDFSLGRMADDYERLLVRAVAARRAA